MKETVSEEQEVLEALAQVAIRIADDSDDDSMIWGHGSAWEEVREDAVRLRDRLWRIRYPGWRG